MFLLPVYFGAAAAGWSLLLHRFGKAQAAMCLSTLAATAWMGCTVLAAKTLEEPRHPEAAGFRSAESMASALRSYVAQGDQFICTQHEDAGLAYAMLRDKIVYRPRRSGDLLIVTPPNQRPEQMLTAAGISLGDVRRIREIAQFADRRVYRGVRGAQLPFTPGGNAYMGSFN